MRRSRNRPTGREDWIVYHAHANPTTFNEDRVIRIQPFTFNSDGTPNFGQPVPPGQLLDVPSVGPDPERPILAGDYQADGLVNDSDYNLWRATFGGAMFPGVAADGNASGAADAADYVLWRKSASSPASQLSVVVESPAMSVRRLEFRRRLRLRSCCPKGLIRPFTIAPADSPKELVTEFPSRRFPSRIGRRLLCGEQPQCRMMKVQRGDALLAWLLSCNGPKHQENDSDVASQCNKSPLDEVVVSRHVALNAIFASLASEA